MAYPPRTLGPCLQVGCAVVWCLFAAGPVFGFAALKPVLIRHGVYHDRCPEGDVLAEAVCFQQDAALNFMFTLAAMVTNMAALLVGSILDRFGPQTTSIIGAVVLFLGSMLFVYAEALAGSVVDPYLSGYTLLALGGPFCFISSFHLANAFPTHLGLVLALLTGAFDSSSALFLGYRMVFTRYANKGAEAQVSLDRFFTVYALVPVFVLLCQVFVMPRHVYERVGVETSPLLGEEVDALEDRRHSLASSMVSASHPARYERRFSAVSRVDSTFPPAKELAVLDGWPIRTQLASPWFFIMTLFTIVQMLRINYFVATLYTQEEYLFDSETALWLNHFFDVALPLGGLVSIPFIGLILDNLSMGGIMRVMVGLSVLMGLCGLGKGLVTYPLLGMLLLVMYRPFFYTAVSDYTVKVFGITTFGTVYGTLICLSGCFNLVQPAMDRITREMFALNPTPVNLVLVGLSAVLGGWLLVYIKRQRLVVERKRMVLEAESAPVYDMP